MNYVIVDVEADGPCPGLYSMTELGAVVLGKHKDPNHGFHGQFRPISDQWVPQALAVSGMTREDVMSFAAPAVGMMEFRAWLCQYTKKDTDRIIFVSDNPAFDWQFVNYYFWKFTGGNPFGHSARRIGDFAAGLRGNWGAHSSWKKLRQTRHTHNPVDDARGNAEALWALMGKT